MDSTLNLNYPQNIAMIGNYLPRRCGIATFTTDLTNAIAKEIENEDSLMVIAMNDNNEGYNYPEKVKFELRQNNPSDYLRAAEFLNVKNIDVTILQHEYGIFGGQSGATLFRLLENLKTPIITNLHTVLFKPTAEQKTIIMRLSEISDRLLVMCHKAEEILHDVYKIPKEKITYIPHGIHDVPFVDSCFYKDKFGLEDKKVILTFGLLGPSKGLESMIDAMPLIVKNHPDAAYVILGETHPHVIKHSGEQYRHSLQQKIHRLGMNHHVLFFNQFVDIKSLTQFLSVADVFVTPYPEKDQITSGTLSYAFGAGKAIVSTPYIFAEELLADERGVLVPFNDSKVMGEAISDLLSNESKRNQLRIMAYQSGRSMVWKEVARNYLKVAQEVLNKNIASPKTFFQDIKLRKLDSLPQISLDHLKIMTDDTGIIQHAYFSIPKRAFGYCTDDNARALVATCMYYSLTKDEQIIPLIKTYISFVLDAYNNDKKRFRNFMSYNRSWVEKEDDDAHGRALWGLGTAIATLNDQVIINGISKIFMQSAEKIEEFESPRAWAFALVGINNYLKIFEGDSTVRKIRTNLASKLFEKFKNNISKDWIWYDDIVTYANAKLPQALLLSGNATGDKEMVELSLEILQWLLKIQTSDSGHLSIIGNDGWYKKGSFPSHFDQQPVDVSALVEACVDAYRITHDKFWQSESQKCFDWFLGRNDINTPVCDFKSGGCYDGLQVNGLNQNMGAESTLAWLISLLTMHSIFSQEVLPVKD
ncbi:MAG: glycosyltransferase family 4 protein [Pseudomonadota bacterium]